MLAVTLALLTILTLFALAVGQSIRTKEQTLLAMSDAKEGFAHAEAALRVGELSVEQYSASGDVRLAVFPIRQDWAAPERTTERWWREHGQLVSISTRSENHTFYTVEMYEREAWGAYFRVTAAAFPRHSPPIVLQSVYAVRSSSDNRGGVPCDSEVKPCAELAKGRQSWLELR